MLPLIRFWLVLHVVLVAGGWLLSPFRALTPGGYLLLALLSAAAAPFVLRAGPGERPVLRAVPLRRFRRLLPALFLALAPLIFIGGCVALPHFLDTTAYHVPRVLHWLHQGGWYWIDVPDQRLNTRGVALEWLTAPLLLFTGGDRSLFLLNFAAWLLVPGLLYAFLRGESVPARTAWFWMWVLGGSFFCVYQAGSAAGDLYPAVLFLAAVVFGRRSARTGSFADLAWSALAAALMTAHKPYNVVLLLPWFLAVWPALRRHLVPALLLLPLAVLCSIAPTAFFNILHGGDWTGFKAEQVYLPLGEVSYTPSSPLIGILGNGILLTVQNLEPPRFVGAHHLEALLYKLTAFPLGRELNESFEGRFFDVFASQGESLSGVGMGVVLLVVGTVLVFRKRIAGIAAPRRLTPFDLGTGAAFLVFLVKAGAFQAARLADSFYFPLLVPVLRRPLFRAAARSRRWRLAAAATLVLSMAGLFLSTDRPLVPWGAVAAAASRLAPGSHFANRMNESVRYENLVDDYFRSLRDAIPASEGTIALLRYHTRTPAASLWRPYGVRNVVEVSEKTPPSWLREHGIRYVVVPVDPPAKSVEPVWSELRREGTVVKELIPGLTQGDVYGYALLRLD